MNNEPGVCRYVEESDQYSGLLWRQIKGNKPDYCNISLRVELPPNYRHGGQNQYGQILTLGKRFLKLGNIWS